MAQKAKAKHGDVAKKIANVDACEMCEERPAMTTALCSRCYQWVRAHTRLEVVNPGHLKTYITATKLKVTRIQKYGSGELMANLTYKGKDASAAIMKAVAA